MGNTISPTHDGPGSDPLEVFDIRPHVTSVRVRRVDAFRGEVIQLFREGVQHDVFLVCVLEGLAPRQHVVHSLITIFILVCLGFTKSTVVM